MRPILVYLLLFASSPALAFDPAPRVKAELSPRDEVWMGQRVTLAITLSTPDFFAGVPSFEIPPIPGVVVLAPAGSPSVGSETIGETRFTTQRHEFSVYAQRAGLVRIPAFRIRFESNSGYGKPVIPRQVTTDALMFHAKTPPGAEGLGTVVSARNLKVTDVWHPEPTTPKVGDAFERVLTVTADDVPGMVIPSFQLDQVEGLAAYPKPTRVSDHIERGALTGQRVEITTYICDAAGTVTVPNRTLTWFDLATNTLSTVTLSSRTFTVAPLPNPEPTLETPSVRSGGWWAAVATLVGILGLAGFLAVRIWPRWVRAYASWTASEPAQFARLRRISQSGDPHAMYVALLQWLDRIGPISLDEFALQAHDLAMTRAIGGLTDRVYHRADTGRSAEWSGRPLFTGLQSPGGKCEFRTLRPSEGRFHRSILRVKRCYANVELCKFRIFKVGPIGLPANRERENGPSRLLASEVESAEREDQGEGGFTLRIAVVDVIPVVAVLHRDERGRRGLVPLARMHGEQAIGDHASVKRSPVGPQRRLHEPGFEMVARDLDSVGQVEIHLGCGPQTELKDIRRGARSHHRVEDHSRGDDKLITGSAWLQVQEAGHFCQHGMIDGGRVDLHDQSVPFADEAPGRSISAGTILQAVFCSFDGC